MAQGVGAVPVIVLNRDPDSAVSKIAALPILIDLEPNLDVTFGAFLLAVVVFGYDQEIVRRHSNEIDHPCGIWVGGTAADPGPEVQKLITVGGTAATDPDPQCTLGILRHFTLDGEFHLLTLVDGDAAGAC